MASDLQYKQAFALDVLHSATVYLKEQFCKSWPRELAQANLEARAILFNRSNAILEENGMGITRDEVYGKPKPFLLDRRTPSGTGDER